MPRKHRIFGALHGSNYVWSEKIVIRTFKKDGYTGLFMTDGRLETYLDDDLVWTSYFVGEDYAEMEFSATVDLMTGEMYA